MTAAAAGLALAGPAAATAPAPAAASTPRARAVRALPRRPRLAAAAVTAAARASGTNDKAGSILTLVRWVSPRAIKETFVPPVDYRYPHMG